MQLKKLSLKDKPLVERFLKFSGCALSAYNFSNIYIWKALYDIRWQAIKENLCIFFRDKTGAFLYLAPLGKQINPQAVQEAFRLMDGFNRNQCLSRIENVAEKDLPVFKNSGYATGEKFCDYLSLRADLAGLKGNRFKPQRALFNYFTKHYKFSYLPFGAQHKQACLKLYRHWAKQRRKSNSDPVYGGMLEDSGKTLKVLLDNYKSLGVSARVVKVGNRLAAFTFGFKLNPETFCILYEISDLSVKGSAQFIFRRFCQELEEYKYINVMDDSGLENLRRVKLSYRPIKLIPNYVISRKDAAQNR